MKKIVLSLAALVSMLSTMTVMAEHPDVVACFDKAETQLELNNCGGLAYKLADEELNEVYQAVIVEYEDDKQFVEKLRFAQRAWIKFRDAQMDAVFPPGEDGKLHHYGSVFPMCWSLERARLTAERTKQLRVWLEGAEDGNVCTGSVRLKQR